MVKCRRKRLALSFPSILWTSFLSKTMFKEEKIFNPQSLIERIQNQNLEKELLFAWSTDIFGRQQMLEVGILQTKGSKVPKLIFEGVLPFVMLDVTKDRLTNQFNITKGRWDSISIDNSPLVWTEGSSDFRVWDSENLLARVDEGELWVPKDVIPMDSIECVELFCSEDWVTRGIRIQRTGADPYLIVKQERIIEQDKYHYDLIELRCDSLWAMSMGLELARHLKKPFVDSLK